MRTTTQRNKPDNRLDVAIFYIMIVGVLLLGGSSRYDLMQVAILQPFLWILLGIGLIRFHGAGEAKPFLIMAAVYAAYLIAQLIPLPFWIWSQLPGRDLIVDADLAVIGETARPFSLHPPRTLNAFAYLPLILAPIITIANVKRERSRHAVTAVIGAATISALIGIFQVLTGELYFYSVTANGRMVGLFANPNHNAVFGSVAIILSVIVWIGSREKLIKTFAIACAGFLFVAMLPNGSRAGFITLIVATTTSLIAVWSMRRAIKQEREFDGKRVAIWLFAIAAICLAGVFFMSGSLGALDRIVDDDPLGDLRFAILPLTWEMAKEFFPLGSGIGTFEKVFHIFEPPELLRPSYVNMAHNDPLQLLVEGGLIAYILIAATSVYLLRASLSFVRINFPSDKIPISICFAGIFVVILIASLFDYPLRTPIFQTCLASLLCSMCYPRDIDVSSESVR